MPHQQIPGTKIIPAKVTGSYGHYCFLARKPCVAATIAPPLEEHGTVVA